ncbi:MAG: peroxidase family protein [Isosphaeraceae bacterium]
MSNGEHKSFSFKVNVLPFMVATIGEFTALYFWLWFFWKEQYVIAVLILLAGFLAERLAVLYWVSQVFGAEVGITGSKKTPLQKVIGLLMITGSEVIVWSIWFFAARDLAPSMGPTASFLIASALLIVGEQLQHSWDLALLNAKRIRDYILNPTTIFITALECGGGISMLYLFQQGLRWPAGIIMFVALAIEHVVQGSLIKPSGKGSPGQAAKDLADKRDQSCDGFGNQVQLYFLTNFAMIWAIVQKIGPLRRRINQILLDIDIYKAHTRPYALSMCAPKPTPENPHPAPYYYTSWDSLTDRTYTGRHLPPKDISGGTPLPDAKEVAQLFKRDKGKETESPKSTLLFSYFAQWFTDGFLRTVYEPVEGWPPIVGTGRNTSNHDIDLTPLYGVNKEITEAIRAKVGGRLKSQMINGEEYAPFYFQDGQAPPEFHALPEMAGLKMWQRLHADWFEKNKGTLFAFGGERSNTQTGFAMFNTLFLREHNRVAGELAKENPTWDDERLFQTARNVMIVLLMKIVIEEYINHIAPYYFRFRVDPPIVGENRWYRQNWMTLEFNLLYRWHGLTPTMVNLPGGKPVPCEETVLNNTELLRNGLGAMFEAASKQPAGDIGLFNTPDFLLWVEQVAIQMGRDMQLASYNDYREAFGFPRVTDFNQISGDPKRQYRLKELYGDVDRIEFYVGLFAEDVRTNSTVSTLIGRMVGIDAFSQALTNPLLAPNIFNTDTFSNYGMNVILETKSISDILHRNVPDPERPYIASLTRLDWRPI